MKVRKFILGNSLTSKALLVFILITGLVTFLFMKIPDERPYEKKIDGVWYNIDSADVGESGVMLHVNFIKANYVDGEMWLLVNYPENLYVLDKISDDVFVPYGGKNEEELKAQRTIEGTVVKKLYDIAIKKWPEKHLDNVEYKKPFMQTFYAKKYLKKS